MSRWILCFSLLALAGCGGEPVIDHSRDPEMFAIDVKELVATSVADARTSDEPADALWGIVDYLAELGRHPTGQHRNVYQQIHALASEIYADAQDVDGRPPDLDERLDELWALAEQLPGDVEPPPITADAPDD